MANEPICTVTYPDGERCDRPVKAGGFCSGHLERRRKYGAPLAGGKLGIRRKPGSPCSIGRIEPWLDQPECPGEHYSLGFCAKHYQRQAHHGDPLATLIDRDHGPTCTFPDCDRPYDAAGLCSLHYGRAWLHDGDPFGGKRIGPVAERIWRRTIEGPLPVRFYNSATGRYDGMPPCACRYWTGTRTRGEDDPRHKYGIMSIDNVKHVVHRVTYELVYGPIPEGITLDHLCCRTLCCEPRHMEPVTREENSKRRWIFTNEIVATFEESFLAGLGVRRQALVWPEGEVPPALPA